VILNTATLGRVTSGEVPVDLGIRTLRS